MAASNRILYVLLFLLVVVPVIVGVMVWHFMKQECDDKTSESEHSNLHETTTSPTTSQTGSGTQTPPRNEKEPWKNVRLPIHVIPIHYHIALYPDFYGNNEWFYGNESIDLVVKEETKYILINVNYLNISQTEVSDSTGTPIPIRRAFEYKPNQFWVVEMDENLQAGQNVSLHLQFNGWLKRAIVGLYKSTYFNSLTNTSSSISTSKFEPVAARRAFPCYDEPNMKAEFTVTLVHQPEYQALSNMPAQNVSVWESDDSMVATKFQRSVKMSTYLVCFIVCDFQQISATTKHNNTVTMYAPADRVQHTRYALEVAVAAVDTYTDLFNIPYPLPKLDLIAIPDFVSGAMEHWGLVTFRETYLLYDPAQASAENKQRVAEVVAHEMAHMTLENGIWTVPSNDIITKCGNEHVTDERTGKWFGNLVTMDWWDDLWLNEGFASFTEYLAVDAKDPDWMMMHQFLRSDLQPVMRTDAGVSSHPIVVHVQNPDQINEVFDSISYSKGASIIRMLENLMGQDAFFKGVSEYLTTYMFQNARTDDLWDKLGNIEAGLSVKDVMATWTKQMGLPYINVSVTGHEVTMEQHRFLADPAAQFSQSESPYAYKWYIGLDFLLSNGESGSRWMKMTDSETISIPIDLAANDTWIKVNRNETGFYRVNYPRFLWKRFSAILQQDAQGFSAADRANLLDDAFNLARASIIGYDVAMDMTLYLSNEQEYIPWKSCADGFKYLSSMFHFSENPGLPELQKHILSRVTPVFNGIGWNDTGSHLQKLLRSTVIIDLACGNGDAACLTTVSRMFHDWLYNGLAISPNLRSSVYKYGMIHSAETRDWEAVWQRYLAETVPQEKVKLMATLAQTTTPWLLLRYIEYAKIESNVRSQDFFNVLIYISRNRVGRGLVWDWIRGHWQYLVDRFTLYSRYFGRMVTSVISSFNTEYQLQEVEAFFARYPDAGAGSRGRQQALESIRRNIRWMATNKGPLTDWLRRHT